MEALAPATPSHCRHCRNDCPAGGEFCCPGCSAAFALISSLGLDDFYSKLGENKITALKDVANPWSNIDFSARVENLPDGLRRLDVSVKNVSCSACAWLLEKIPLVEPKIRAARWNGGTRLLSLVFDPTIAPASVVAFLGRLGFETYPPSTDGDDVGERRAWLMRASVATASMLATMHVSLTLYAGILEGMSKAMSSAIAWVAFVLTLPALLYAAKPFYKNAWLALKFGRINMDSLVSLSIFAGTAASLYNIAAGVNEYYFDAVAMLVALLLWGRLVVYFLERSLLQRNYTAAWDPDCRHKGLAAGDMVEIKTGEIIPCDGEVVDGKSLMEISWLTGESEPAVVQRGANVFAGAVNLTGKITVTAKAVGEQTRAGQILKKLTNVNQSRFAVLSHRLESWLVAVIGFLALGILGWSLAHGQNPWPRMVSLLMVTCPCALGLAVPTVLAQALQQAARRGILIKDGEVLERLSEIDMVVFDKTGTLTAPQMNVAGVEWRTEVLESAGLTRERAGAVIKNMVSHSNHVLSRALAARFANSPSLNAAVTEFPGEGLEMKADGHHFKLGRGNIFSIDGNTAAVFSYEIPFRKEIQTALKRLGRERRVVILSGDAPEKVSAAAVRFGINEALGGQTPEMKLSFLETAAGKNKIMMVGDGINDILAFRKSHVSVALAGGSGASFQYCDVFLMSADIAKIPALLAAGRRVSAAIKMNFLWAVLYNAAGIFLVFKGILGPVACAFLMPLSSLTVVAAASLRSYFGDT